MKVKITRKATYIIDVEDSNNYAASDVAYSRLHDDNWTRKPDIEDVTIEVAKSMDDFILSLPESVRAAVDVLARYSQTDGAHHKDWVMDQAIRALIGTRYDEFISIYMHGDDGPSTYSWDQGIAP